MAIEPYAKQLSQCIETIKNQTAETEVIVSEHEVRPYINLNELRNKGMKAANSDTIFFCDADFLLTDKNFLRNLNSRL